MVTRQKARNRCCAATVRVTPFKRTKRQIELRGRGHHRERARKEDGKAATCRKEQIVTVHIYKGRDRSGDLCGPADVQENEKDIYWHCKACTFLGLHF